jgi:hypothetical protein
MDNGTLRDHLADVINERNELLRKVESLQASIYKQGLQLGFMERRLEEQPSNKAHCGRLIMTEFLGLVIMVFSVFMTGLLLGQSSKK